MSVYCTSVSHQEINVEIIRRSDDTEVWVIKHSVGAHIATETADLFHMYPITVSTHTQHIRRTAVFGQRIVDSTHKHTL